MYEINEQKKRSYYFTNELQRLKEFNFINEETFNTVKEAYSKYDEDYSRYIKENYAAGNKHKQNQDEARIKTMASPEQIRERNISIIMIIGVVLLLLGGVILGTSTWDIMNDIVKTLLIFMVCFLFYGISLFSEKVLKINKTAYAFLSLAALFLPIAILSAAYFKLFGEWLSFYGDGRYILGVIGSGLCTLLYVIYAMKKQSKIFTWFALAADTFTLMFIIMAIDDTVKSILFGLLIYCSLLCFLYHGLKGSRRVSLFISQLPKYLLVVTALLTLPLIFMRNNIFNGISIIISSVVFLYLYFDQKQKQFAYIFSLLMLYGMFRLIQHNFTVADLVLYSAAGIVFIIIEKCFNKDLFLRKLSVYFSSLTASLAFIIVTYYSFQRFYGQGSFIVLICYVLIFINMVCAAYVAGNKALNYSASLFLLAVGYQTYLLIRQGFEGYKFGIHMFVFSAIIFILLYYKNNFKYLVHLKKSSMVTALIMMYISAAVLRPHNMYLIYTLEIMAVTLFLFLAMGQKEKEYEIKILLYLILSNITLLVEALVKTELALPKEYILSITSFIIFIIYLVLKGAWKERVVYYFIIFAMISQVQLNSIQYFYIIHFIISLLIATAVLYAMSKKKWNLLGVLPIVLVLYSIIHFISNLNYDGVSDFIIVLILGCLFILFKSAGEIISKDLYIIKDKRIKYLDWYFLAALLLCLMLFNYSYDMNIVYRLIPGLLLIYLLGSQPKRVHSEFIGKLFLSMAVIAILIPYYTLIIEYLNVRSFYYTLALYLPLIILSEIIINTAWKNNKKKAYAIQWVTVIFVSCGLLWTPTLINTVIYPIIVGILAAVAIITGMQYRIRCYFFVGIVTLVVNIIVQTRNLWGNMPWWTYLIFSGLILIATASFNEWQKKNDKKLIKDNIDRFKDWL
jgi:hypothetical protein